MYHDLNFDDVLAGSAKAARQVEDVIHTEAQLGLGHRFVLDWTRPAPCSSAA